MAERDINWRLVLFVFTAVLVAAILWAARSALPPFVLGLVLAYLLAPVVTWLHRHMPGRLAERKAARPLAVLLVYFAALAVVAVALATLGPPLIHQAQDLIARAPTLATNGIDRLERAFNLYYLGAPQQVRDLADQILRSETAQELPARALAILQQRAVDAVGWLGSTLTWVLGFVIVPIWLVYVLANPEGIVDGAIRLVPKPYRADVVAIRVIFDRVLSAYIRGQLVVAVALGLMFTVALVLLRVPYALLLGVVAGALSIIPVLGSILGMVPAVAVAASQSLRLAALVVLAFIGIQMLDNMFISPRVQGRSVALNPALIMVVLVVGQTLLGPLGLIAAAPIAAIGRDVVHYLYVRVGPTHPPPLDALAEIGYAEAATETIAAASPQAPLA